MNRHADRVLEHVEEHLNRCDNPDCKLALAMITQLRKEDENRQKDKR